MGGLSDLALLEVQPNYFPQYVLSMLEGIGISMQRNHDSKIVAILFNPLADFALILAAWQILKLLSINLMRRHST